MKLVVEISEEHFKKICANKEDAIIAHDTCRRIANGTPLDAVLGEIRTEIESAYEDLDGYDPDALPTYIDRVGDIIDKYKAEGSEKK